MKKFVIIMVIALMVCLTGCGKVKEVGRVYPEGLFTFENGRTVRIVEIIKYSDGSEEHVTEEYDTCINF